MAPHLPTSPEERLVALEKDVQHTHELMLDMHARLFGNHQPGELAEINRRLSRLEAYRLKVVGFVAGCSTLGGVAGAIAGILVHLKKGS